MYGHHYSPATVSNITKAVQEQVEAFHQRTISEKYAIIYGDATYLSVRRDSVAKEALHILIGITHKGEKEVLDYALSPSESADNYREMLQSLKQRGLEQVLLFVPDGLNDFKNACLEVYPNAKHQSCWTHVARNVMKHVCAKDKSKVMDDLKPVWRFILWRKADNSRNGYNTKTLHTSYGDMELDVPRDRNGEFEPKIVKEYQNTLTQDMEEKILSMNAKGMTTSDIENHMQELYGVDISDSTISRITDKYFLS
jgi:putative transposase